MINHLNPALSKTRRILQPTCRRQIKLTQSIDSAPPTSFSLEHKQKPFRSIHKEQSSEAQALKDTIFRMAMQITELKSQNTKLVAALEQAQNMEQFYLKELQQRKNQISKLQDIVTLSKISQTSIDTPFEIGLRSQPQPQQSILNSSSLKPACGQYPSKLQMLKKKFQNKENIWEGHRRMRSEMKR